MKCHAQTRIYAIGQAQYENLTCKSPKNKSYEKDLTNTKTYDIRITNKGKDTLQTRKE